MADTNHKPEWRQGESADELDRMLDANLAKYAAVEPRAGLEERVLANLRAQPAQRAGHSWWQWTLAAGLAAVVVVTITLLWRVRTPVHPVISNKPTVTKPAPVNSTPQVAQRNTGTTDPAKPHRSQVHRMVAAAPKLDQFPAPQPLNEQEKLLASYVARFGDDAVIVARARAEALREELEKEAKETGVDTNHDVQAR